MKELPLNEQDRKLIEIALETIKKRYKKNWHHIGAALRDSHGEVFSTINIDANVGRAAVCAEPIALANAIMSGSKKFDTIVAVKYQRDKNNKQVYKVVSPCGMCREIISDYDPDTRVIVENNGKLVKIGIMDLLPLKYKK
jgi:cytidine deaminase